MRQENTAIQEAATKAWKNYSPLQKEKLLSAIRIDMLKKSSDDSAYRPAPTFLEFRAVEVIIRAINHGLPSGDVTGLVAWYGEQAAAEEG